MPPGRGPFFFDTINRPPNLNGMPRRRRALADNANIEIPQARASYCPRGNFSMPIRE